MLLVTGQFLAADSRISFAFWSVGAVFGKSIDTLIVSILLGFAAIIFSISIVVFSKFQPLFSAFIPMMVIIHEPSAVATRSVGEKLSPLPLLSIGASVWICVFDLKWVAWVLN